MEVLEPLWHLFCEQKKVWDQHNEDEPLTSISDTSLFVEVCTNLIVIYHWRELPRLSFLSRQTQKWSFVAKKVCLPRQNLLFLQKLCLKSLVCRDNSKLVVTKHLSRQKYDTRLSRENFRCDKNDTCGTSRQ